MPSQSGDSRDSLSGQQGQEIALVLGAGGARGLAHIGAIEALEHAGMQIRAISGSSMGALVGGIYAAGRLDDYRDWVCSLGQSDVLKLVDWTLSGGGLIRGRRIIEQLRELIGDVDIESLDIDFTAVAVDLDANREIWLSDGSLFEAIRSSIAIPGLFTPHRYRGRTLVDGGILNPIPVAPTLRCLTDRTVVVNVNGRPRRLAEVTDQSSGKAGDGDNDQGIMDRLRGWFGKPEGEQHAEPEELGLLEVLMRSLETMQSVIARQHLAVYRPDLIVEIPRNAGIIHEFHRGRELIELGRKLTDRALSQPDDA